MFIGEFEKSRKPAKVHSRHSLVIVGGGLTGVCCAITAARAGADVALIQDRPVLGGNASSEVRLWALGATSHMGNNNRWSREGGVIDEILVENTFRNREGNPVLFDMVLIDKVLSEPNITLYLNTCVYDAEMSGRTVRSVTAFNPQTGTHHTIEGDLFADCSGDGALAYMAGAEYRMGAEDREEYGEKFAPDKTRYGELLGHSILFYIKDTGRPVRFEAPEFALKEVEELIPRAPESGVFQHLAARLQILVAGIRRTAGHDPGYRKNQIRTLENRLRRLESHQKFGQVPGDGELHARMGRAFPRQTRKPAVQGLLHADPAGHHRTARALRRRFVRRLVDRPAPRRRRLRRRARLQPSGTARASTRFPTAVW